MRNYLAAYLVPAMVMMAATEGPRLEKPGSYKVNFCDEDENVYVANSLRNHVRGIADDLEKNNGWNQLAPPSVIEWATRPDSEIGKQGAAAGVTVFRLTQETGDLTKNIGKECAADLAINHPGCHLWG